MKQFFLILFLAGTAYTLSACGRVSPPEGPADAFYPHTYIVKDTEGAAK